MGSRPTARDAISQHARVAAEEVDLVPGLQRQRVAREMGQAVGDSVVTSIRNGARRPAGAETAIAAGMLQRKLFHALQARSTGSTPAGSSRRG
jgi:hypothetical protein